MRKYSRLALPDRPFVPGQTPRPAESVYSGDARETFLHAIDLFNGGFWWECHQELEHLWIAAGKRGERARFFQGLVQVCATCLNRLRGKPAGEQAKKALAKFAGLGSPYLGVDLKRLGRDVRSFLREGTPPRIELDQHAAHEPVIR